MKRFAIFVLILMTVVTLAACGGSGNNLPGDNTGKAEQTQSAPQTSALTEKAQSPETAPESGASPSTEPAPVSGTEGLAVSESADECRITGPGTVTETDIVIPSHINGKPVTLIDECAFQENREITSVVIPWTVKKIDEDAFAGCTALASVTFSEGLEYISEGGFYGCSSLTKLTLPASLISVGNRGFAYCGGLTEITFLGNTTVVNSGFNDCENLKSIVFDGKTGESYMIRDNAFQSSKSLERLVLAPGLTEIGSWNFSESSLLKEVFLPKSVTKLGACAFLRSGVEKVYYEGTEEEWNNVTVKEATFTPEVIFNSTN
ncbi:MAG: leucine-rich repeat domain-containing protein [Clostridia bacterium]|nr:leucine-rich repeat domain-containing protein [Clostridia bacterium]MBQ3869156.1 leucine-rich repeat domain-containing protein [Clostridia bacterium]